MGELANITDFLGKVHTAATAKHSSEVKRLIDIDDTQRIFVLEGELINTYLNVYAKKFPVILEEVNEAGIISAFNNIIDGVNKLNKRQTIATYTKPGTLVSMEILAAGQVVFEQPITKRWTMRFNLMVEWATS